MPPLNGNLKWLLASAGVLITFGAGWGSLKSEVVNNAVAIEVVRTDLENAKTNVTGSVVATNLQAQLNEINHRLTNIELSQQRIEALLDKINR